MWNKERLKSFQAALQPEEPLNVEPPTLDLVLPPRPSYYLRDQDPHSCDPGKPNRDTHEHCRVRLNLFLLQMLNDPATLKRAVVRKRREAGWISWWEAFWI